jgi:hypothetical protein
MQQRNNSRNKTFSHKEKFFPMQTLVLHPGLVTELKSQQDTIKHYQAVNSIPLDKLCPIGSEVFYIGSSYSHYGVLGKILNSKTKDTLDIEVSGTVDCM